MSFCPKTIFFDYGNTLCTEPEFFDGIKGFAALIARADENPQNATPEQLWELQQKVRHDMDKINSLDLEVNHREILRLITDSFGLRFSISDCEMEDILWNTAFPASPIDGVNELMELLKTLGIRTAVVSNMSFSGEALQRRIARHVTSGSFEFVLASSDCFYRKPNVRIFAAALGRANISPEECAFCGDSVTCDIIPSAKLGMQPIWLPKHSDAKKLRKKAVTAGALIFESYGDFCSYARENWQNNG